MPASDLTLVEFLTARLDEDEAAVWPLGTDESGRTMYADADSERVLRDVKAMRRIVASACEMPPSGVNFTDYMRGIWVARQDVLYELASIWADHPDCREEWKP
jgi:hypothetical protein